MAVRLQTASEAGLHLLPNSVCTPLATASHLTEDCRLRSRSAVLVQDCEFFISILGTKILTPDRIMRRTGKYWGLILTSASLSVLSTSLIARWDKNYPSEFELWFDIVPNALGVSSLITSTLIVSHT
jgi:hypothetical protein